MDQEDTSLPYSKPDTGRFRKGEVLENYYFLQELLNILNNGAIIKFLNEFECILFNKNIHLGTSGTFLQTLVKKHKLFSASHLSTTNTSTHLHGHLVLDLGKLETELPSLQVYRGFTLLIEQEDKITVVFDKSCDKVHIYELQIRDIARAIFYLRHAKHDNAKVMYLSYFERIELEWLLTQLFRATDPNDTYDTSQLVRFTHSLPSVRQPFGNSGLFWHFLRSFTLSLSQEQCKYGRRISSTMMSMENASDSKIDLKAYSHIADFKSPVQSFARRSTLVKLEWSNSGRSIINSVLSQKGLPLEIQRHVIKYLFKETFQECNCELEDMDLHGIVKLKLYPILTTTIVDEGLDKFCVLALVSTRELDNHVKSYRSKQSYRLESDILIMSTRHISGVIHDTVRPPRIITSSDQIEQIAASISPPNLPLPIIECGKERILNEYRRTFKDDTFGITR
jgi:hypothetical protein